MARTQTGSPEEALAGEANNGRVPMGNDAYTASAPSATEVGRATLVPKGHSKSQDPTIQSKPSRVNVPVDHEGPERNGARYGVRVNINAPISHEAGMTQANGRIFSSSVKRTNDSFSAGVDTSY